MPHIGGSRPASTSATKSEPPFLRRIRVHRRLPSSSSRALDLDPVAAASARSLRVSVFLHRAAAALSTSAPTLSTPCSSELAHDVSAGSPGVGPPEAAASTISRRCPRQRMRNASDGYFFDLAMVQKNAAVGRGNLAHQGKLVLVVVYNTIGLKEINGFGNIYEDHH